MFEDRHIYESYLDGQLARWKGDLEELRAEATRVGAGTQVHFEQSIDALQNKHDEVSHHLSSLRGASDEAWAAVKASTGKGWMEFKSVFQSPAGNAMAHAPRAGQETGPSMPE